MNDFLTIDAPPARRSGEYYGLLRVHYMCTMEEYPEYDRYRREMTAVEGLGNAMSATSATSGSSARDRIKVEDETSTSNPTSASEEGASSVVADSREAITDPPELTSSVPTDRKGKGKALDLESDNEPLQSENCPLLKLPIELIDRILSYLSPVELCPVAATCRLLYLYVTDDRIWHGFVQDHVPGMQVTSSYPYTSFRALFTAHDPHWFLPKHKIWFCDHDLTGRLVIVRYDQSRGCIEGYQLVAVSNRTSFQTWQADSQVTIHAFEPKVRLHLDKPIVHLHGKSSENMMHEARPGIDASGPGASLSDEVKGCSVERQMQDNPGLRLNYFPADIRMHVGPDNTICHDFLLARPLSAEKAERYSAETFPYGNIWPPPTVPASHRVASCQRGKEILAHENRPRRRSETSDQTFRIQSWLPRFGRRRQEPTGGIPSNTLPALRALLGVGDWANLNSALRTEHGKIATYSTLDPALYTPTPEKPYRGIWVGDYSGHGCEFLLIHQPDDDDDNNNDGDDVEPDTIRRENETEDEFAQRQADEKVYRGRLEAIKLTGDPNIPRGEYTFVVDDLGEKGFVTVVQDEPFCGARVVKSKGHIAETGFSADTYIESQLILISHNRLAQYWVGFQHISFFERVDIDQFLVPE
ncbi:hypothetical protein QBC46DRAFT_386406 [Diplogelasinospora grovesii]|uniref:F-box domain-containing protein n=1 Tax=Diplogelasinospora grovesii TaxID=303347 RepID=A0AAN6S4X7_9PEZI|nr:hypothetical protein QBC46DRAFT_386406 [Diplogelasinospora grovesii]